MARYLFVDPNIDALLRGEPRSVGGASVQAFTWLRGLAALGEDVAAVVQRDADAGQRLAIHTFPGYRPRGGAGYLTVQAPFLASVMRTYRPDFVYQGAAGAITGLLAVVAPAYGARFIHRMANDADVDERIRSRLRWSTRVVYHYGLRRAAAVLCQTRYQAKRLSMRLPRRRIFTVGNPMWLADERAPSPPDERRYVAWLGLFQRQKNVAGLEALARRLPGVPFAVAGRLVDGADAATRASVERLAALTNVRMEGYLGRDRVHGFLAAAHALVSTSHFEGFPNTYLEAWSVGTPVLALKTADPDGLIARHGLGGVAGTVDELTDLVEEAVGAETCGELQRRCIRYVRDHHDAVMLAGRLRDWLHDTFPLRDR